MNGMLIKEGEKYIDVSKKKIIIWGAGQTAVLVCSKLQIENISYVIDNDVSKVAKKIFLYDRQYTINYKDVLDSLPEGEYFILITARLCDEIYESICKHWPNKFSICKGYVDFMYLYSNLQDMFLYDPYIHNKITIGNISRNIKKYCLAAEKIIDKCIDRDAIVGYCSKELGMNSIAILVICEKEKYFLKVPTKRIPVSEHGKVNEGVNWLKVIYKKKIELGIGRNLRVEYVL